MADDRDQQEVVEEAPSTEHACETTDDGCGVEQQRCGCDDIGRDRGIALLDHQLVRPIRTRLGPPTSEFHRERNSASVRADTSIAPRGVSSVVTTTVAWVGSTTLRTLVDPARRSRTGDRDQEPDPIARLAVEGREVRGTELDLGEHAQRVCGDVGSAEIDVAGHEPGDEIGLHGAVHQTCGDGDASLERGGIGV